MKVLDLYWPSVLWVSPDERLIKAIWRMREFDVGAALREALEGDVLARVVHLVAVLAQVRDDVVHELVVRPPAAVEDVELAPQPLQELVEVHVLVVPSGDRIEGLHAASRYQPRRLRV